MMKLNKSDEEIIGILRETFLNQGNELLTPDDHTRNLILRLLLGVSVFGWVSKMAMWIAGKDVSDMSEIIALPTSIFFGFLFIHINNKSENFSLLIFGLTWVSIVLGFYA